jgi:hypothetical protein
MIFLRQIPGARIDWSAFFWQMNCWFTKQMGWILQKKRPLQQNHTANLFAVKVFRWSLEVQSRSDRGDAFFSF